MVKYNYYFLHGFLGDQNFFKPLEEKIKKIESTGDTYNFSLFAQDTPSSLSPVNGFNEWSVNFNNYVKSRNTLNNIMIAYSMGGRLGVHAFFQNQELWDRCYFISSNPGLIKQSQKMVRMAWEDGWCYQLDHKDWGEFMSLWNRQDIFRHDKSVVLDEQKYSKESLKLALKNWSLTKHQVDLKQISNENLHWLVGEKDEKYRLIHKELQQKYNVSNIHLIPEQGHRINDFPAELLSQL